MLSSNEKIAWIRLYRTRNIGPRNFKKLCAHYGSANEALSHLTSLAKNAGGEAALPPQPHNNPRRI